MRYRIDIGITTNKGSYRSHNEDNFLCSDKYKNIFMKDATDDISIQRRGKIPLLLAVCDGMGGSNYGKDASFMAVHNLSCNWQALNKVDKNQVQKGIDQLINQINVNVFSLEKQRKKAGSTLALVYLHEDRIYLANVGDSRIYCYQNQAMNQLSVDHNQAQDMIHLGIERKNTKIGQNVLTQYIGMSPDEVVIEPHYNTLEYDDMTLLLCSDGLNEALDEGEITAILTQYENKNLKKATNDLILRGIKQGAKDNITAILIRIKKR